jgi:hypothetical protein
MFPEESLLLHFHDQHLVALCLLLQSSLLQFDLALHPVHSQLLLPQLLDLPLMLGLPHPSFLLVHLLQSLVLRKLLHQLHLELVLHSFLFRLSFFLQSPLVLLCINQLLLDSFPVPAPQTPASTAHSSDSPCTPSRPCAAPPAPSAARI